MVADCVSVADCTQGINQSFKEGCVFIMDVCWGWGGEGKKTELLRGDPFIAQSSRVGEVNESMNAIEPPEKYCCQNE